MSCYVVKFITMHFLGFDFFVQKKKPAVLVGTPFYIYIYITLLYAP